MTTQQDAAVMDQCGGCGETNSDKRCIGCAHPWRDAVERQLRDCGIDHVVHNFSEGACVAILVKAVEDQAVQPLQPAPKIRNCLSDAERAHMTGMQDLAKQATTPQPVQPSIDVQALQDAYRAGWEVASQWAERDDLMADIGSPAYLKEMAAALSQIQAPPASTKDAA